MGTQPQTRPEPVVSLARSTAHTAAWLQSAVRTSPALMFSILFHVVILLVLAIATIATVQRKPELALTAVTAERDSRPMELETLELEPLDELELSEALDESTVPEIAELAMTDVEVPVVSAVESNVSAGSPGDSAGTASVAKRALANRAPAKRPGRAVQFCGTAAAGNRFAFVVDNSVSMTGSRLLATVDQLRYSVDQMTGQQEFFVVFYSDVAYPMFYPEPSPGFIEASASNKRRLWDWLRTVEINFGGNLGAAVDMTLDLSPDAMFILGDGKSYSPKVLDALTGINPRRQGVINTIAVGAGPQGKQTLLEIARVNGGQFQAFEPPRNYEFAARANPMRANPKGAEWSKRLGIKPVVHIE